MARVKDLVIKCGLRSPSGMCLSFASMYSLLRHTKFGVYGNPAPCSLPENRCPKKVIEG